MTDGLRDIHRKAIALHSTNDLVAHYKATTDLPHDSVEAIVGAGIDLLYTMRDADANMHSAGAAVAIEAVMTHRRVVTAIPERFREDDTPEPYTNPVSGVEEPVSARDVLSPEEFRDYQRERRTR
jgi:hypothetical protein